RLGRGAVPSAEPPRPLVGQPGAAAGSGRDSPPRMGSARRRAGVTAASELDLVEAAGDRARHVLPLDPDPHPLEVADVTALGADEVGVLGARVGSSGDLEAREATEDGAVGETDVSQIDEVAV